MANNVVNLSPWVDELNKHRQNTKVESDSETDVAIIGGGISGLTTAFFSLKFTEKKVILIEAGKIGHGATGHNAGQVVDYFEKPFAEIVEEYGLDLAVNAQKSISSAWDLLDFILKEAAININFSRFIGYAGCTSLEQLIEHFENKKLKSEAGLEVYKVEVSEKFKELKEIPPQYRNLYDIVPQSIVNELLETDNSNYIAALQSRKGTLNSALFVEKLCEYLIEAYSDRFNLYEFSPVSLVSLNNDHAALDVNGFKVIAKKVVLCTNGFENLNIVNNSGANIDKKFHDMVYGRVGYMAAYIEDKINDPIAISYLPDKGNPEEDEIPYYYLTRRNHTYNKNEKSLVCIGGPEDVKTEEGFKYDAKAGYSEEVENGIKKFLNKSFKHTPEELNNFHFKWHGLMGYTKSGLRCVGVEPINSVLLYNLGCNGIGILPSIFGAKKISDHIANIVLQETIFDPYIQRRSMNSKKIMDHIKNFGK